MDETKKTTVLSIANATLKRVREGKLALGFCPFHLRSVAAAMLARATGYDWLPIDTEQVP